VFLGRIFWCYKLTLALVAMRMYDVCGLVSPALYDLIVVGDSCLFGLCGVRGGNNSRRKTERTFRTSSVSSSHPARDSLPPQGHSPFTTHWILSSIDFELSSTSFLISASSLPRHQRVAVLYFVPRLHNLLFALCHRQIYLFLPFANQYLSSSSRRMMAS